MAQLLPALLRQGQIHADGADAKGTHCQLCLYESSYDLIGRHDLKP
jgi:hypothetical protein